MFFFGRGVSAFFNQLFKWLFWSKKGQKLLFSVLIVVIFFVFIKCGEVAAVEEVEDVNYEVLSYYQSVTNDAISLLGRYYLTHPNSGIWSVMRSDVNMQYYFYYGNIDGSSYANAMPMNKTSLNFIEYPSSQGFTKTATTDDYLGVTGHTLYKFGGTVRYRVFSGYNTTETTNTFSTFYMPLILYNYKTDNWIKFEEYIRDGSTEEIISLLEDIKAEQQATNEALTNTTPSSETDSFVEVDSSSVDDLSSSSVDNVFSNMTTNFANKFTNYDLSTVYSFVWNLNGTRITFYSDALYKMIQGTFFETLLSMLWYYIFGHYAFVWLSNIIHKIKDGSILDGLEVNEVITKEML